MIKKRLFKYGSVFMCAAMLACSLGVYATSTNKSTTTQEVTATTAAAGYDSETVISDAITSQLANAKKSTSSTTNSKEETVYVFAKANGSQDHVIVNEKLNNVTGMSSISDVSKLKNISNVTGDEKSTNGSNNELTWAANGNSITYQGTTTESAPVTMKITYKLDGKEVTPEQLAGKSGKVTIRYDYTNNAKKTVTVDGKSYTVAVPFTMITGMVLPTDKFSNIEVTNGKISEMSDSNVVLGITMPGLKDTLSLKFDNETLDMDIPEYFEVTADVKDFELDMSMSMATSNLLTDMNVDDLSIDSLKDKMNELQDASNQLIDGTVALQDGTQTLADSVPALKDGTQALSDGLTQLTDKVPELTGGVAQLDEGASELNKGAVDLSSGVNAYADGVASANAGASALNENMTAYAEAMQQLYDTLANGDTALDKSVKKLADGAADLNAGIKNTLLGSLSSGKDEYKGLYDTSYEAAYNYVFEKNVQAKKYETCVQMSIADPANLPQEIVTAIQDGVKDTLEKSGISETPDIATTLKSNSNQMTSLVGALNKVYAGVAATDDGKELTNIVTMITSLTQSNAAYKTLAGSYENISKSGLVEGAGKLSAGLNKLQESVGSFDKDKYKEGTLCSSIYALNLNAQKLKTEGTEKLSEGLTTLDSNSAALKEGVSKLSTGTATLKAGTTQLNEGASSLADGATQLSDGANQLNTAAVTLVDGVDALNDGAITLKDGMAEFNEKGIQSLTSLVGTDADKAVDTIKAVVKAGQEYQSFAGKSDDMEGSVMFIYKTEGITK